MKFLKSSLWRIIFCAMLCLTLASEKASAGEEDIAYVKEVLNESQSIESGQTWANVTLLGPLGKINVEVNSKSVFKPELSAKGEMVMTYTALWGVSGKKVYPFYFTEENNEPTAYWSSNGKWYKEVNKNQKIDSRLLIEGAAVAKLKDGDLIKDAKTIFDNDIQRKVEVVFDGKAIGGILQEIVDAEKAKKDEKKKSSADKEIKFFLQNLGDMPAILTIDVKTKRITAAEAELSPVLRKAAEAGARAYMPQATPDHLEVINRLLDSCTLKIDAVYTMHNSVSGAEISVPQEAKAAAVFSDEMRRRPSMMPFFPFF